MLKSENIDSSFRENFNEKISFFINHLFIYRLSILGFLGGLLVKKLPANAGDEGDADSFWVRKIP